MRLKKQLRALSWGTPIKLIVGNELVFNGNVSHALRDKDVKVYLESFTQTVRMEKDENENFCPVLQIILKPLEE